MKTTTRVMLSLLTVWLIASGLALAQTQTTVTIQDVLSAPEKWVNRELQLTGEIRNPQQLGEVGRGAYQLCGPKGEAITVRTKALPGAGEMAGGFVVTGSVDVDPATSTAIIWESQRQSMSAVATASAPPPPKTDVWTYVLVSGGVVLLILIVALASVLRTKPETAAPVVIAPGSAHGGDTIAAAAPPAVAATQAYSPPATPATQEFLGITLTVTEGPDTGRSFAVSKPSTTIGRAPGQDVHLSDGTVSREHARVLAQSGGLQIVNQSTRGTLVNGQEVDSRALTDGDKVQLGATVLTVKMAARAGAASAATQEYRPAGASAATTQSGATQEFLGAQLEVATGPHSGAVHAISQRTVTVGRSNDRDLSLPNDQTVSREHCQIRYQDGQFLLVAEPDKTVSVNSQEVVTVALNDGDEIQLGGTKLLFRRL